MPGPSTTSELPDDIRESIAIAGVNSVAGQPSMLSNLAYANLIGNVNLSQQNTVSNQQSADQLALAVLGSTVNLVADLSPLEATATVKLDTGNDVAEQLADLKATVQAFSGGGIRPHPPIPPLPPVNTPRLVKENPGWMVQFRQKDLPLRLQFLDPSVAGTTPRHEPNPNGSGTIVYYTTKDQPMQLEALDDTPIDVRTL